MRAASLQQHWSYRCNVIVNDDYEAIRELKPSPRIVLPPAEANACVDSNAKSTNKIQIATEI